MSATLPPLMQAAIPSAETRVSSLSLGHPAYRPDIDGLRAIAVLSVVAFHAFPASAGGGFIGVDVFFIISGFLISTILFGNLQRERFSLTTFYARRIKRIFPALLLVLIAAFGFGWWSLLADEYEQLGKHVAAGAGFVSNLVLWSESGYFDAAADTKPLLHLWSLGIEEQFYIFWPVLLWAFWRMRINLLVLTLATACASFASNLYLMQTNPVADFYSPYSRFWELALGSTLAYLTLFEQPLLTHLSSRHRDLQSVLGGSLLLIGAFTIRSSSAFPGWLALLPTVGTVLIIAAGSSAWFNRIVLSNRIMVWFGLISFPLYLWHWPILSFVRILAAERPTRGVRFAAIALAILLAWLTYRFVERPIREGSGSRRKTIMLLISMVFVGAIGFACFRDDGFGFRSVANVAIVNDGDIGHDVFYKYPYQHFALCTPLVIREQAETWNGATRCFQSRSGPIDTVLLGDSHAEHLFIGVAEALPNLNVAFYVHSSIPTIDNEQFATIYRTVLDDANIKSVILAAWWTLRFAEVPRGSTPEEELQKSIRALNAAGKTVYITDDTPNFSFSPRLCKFESSFFRKHKCSEEANFYGRQLVDYSQMLHDLERDNPAVHVLQTSRYFCDLKECSMARDGKLLFRDSDHLSINGSQYLGRRLVRDYPALLRPGVK